MSLNDVITSTEFQNRFGMHTKPFQELAAYILIMAREHTDLSVREVGAYVKNLMQEKHKLELDLAGEFSQSKVQAALIAGQEDEIKRLKQENDTLASCLSRDQGALRSLGFVLGDEGWKLPAHISLNQTEAIRTLKAEVERLQKAHDHQYSMAGQMLREAERKANALLIAEGSLNALKAQVEQAEQNSFDTQNALKQECAEHKATKGALQAALTDAEQAKAERNKLSNEYHEIQKLRDFKNLVHRRLDEMGVEKFEGADCRIAYRLQRVESLISPHDSFHKLCLAACHEANRARGLFPKPNHLTLALAEEAGEVTKAVLDHRQGKTSTDAVRKEIVQTMAMCLRLASEGDPTVDLPAL